MKLLSTSFLLFASIEAANHLLPRTIGDSCQAPEGKGTCQKTSNCVGIAYPNNYCPNDPVDVQCCVNIACSPPGGAGTCRHTDQGCSGGSFKAGYCPGPANIQCCATGGSSTAPPNTGSACTANGKSGICRSVSQQGCSGGSFHPGTKAPWPCPGSNDIQCCVKDSTPAPDPTPKPPTIPSDCSDPKPNTCNFYSLCVESRLHCGSSGYPLGYGQNYCQKFTAASPRMSPLGQSWVTKTMLCLQRDLVPFGTGAQSTTCPALRSFAFATHPDCYVKSGVCLLPPSDWEIIIQTVSLPTLFESAEALKATLKTAQGCLDFYKWLIARGIVKVVDGIVEGAKDLWDAITSWF